MTLEQIHYFITLSNCLNFTTAASQLQISVSTLSRQLVQMERELNVQLMYRDKRNVSLTSCGNFFKREAEDIYQHYQQAASTTRQIYQGYSGSISVGILPDITLNGKIQNGIDRFQKKHPDITLKLERGSYKQLTDGLFSGKYDCIFCYFFALGDILSLRYKIIEKIQEGVLISAKNPLSRKKQFEMEDFKNETFILLSPEDNNYVSTGPFEFFKKHGVYPKVIYAPNLDTATLMVEAGQGVCFSYGKSIGSYNPSMKFLPTKEGEVMTHSPQLVLAWTEKLMNPSAKAFISEEEGSHPCRW